MDENKEENNNEQKGYGKRPLWQWAVFYLIVAVVVYGLIYYFLIGKKAGYSNNQAQTTPVQTSQAPSSAATASQITVQGTEFAFSPSTVTVNKGQAIQLTFKNGGAFPHNLAIADLNVKTKTIQPGEQDTIEFTPDKTGSFTFTCTVDSHADKGMTGTLVVQ